MNPIVSIITPAYNHEKFIGECIESAIAQTFKQWEMLVIDDASTDATAAIVERYARDDQRVRLIKHESNYGIELLANSYNEALAQARGGLVAILEADDMWLPEKLAIQVPAFDDDNVTIAHSNITLVRFDGVVIEDTKYRNEKGYEECLLNTPVGRAYRCLLLGRSPIAAVSAVVRKSALQRVGGFQSIDGLNTTDYPTWLALAATGQFAFSDQPLAKFRRHSDASSMGRLSIASINAAINWQPVLGESLETLCQQAGFASVDMLRQAQENVLTSRKRNYHLQRASKALQIQDWAVAEEELGSQISTERNWWRKKMYQSALMLVQRKINPLRLVGKSAVKKFLIRT